MMTGCWEIWKDAQVSMKAPNAGRLRNSTALTRRLFYESFDQRNSVVLDALAFRLISLCAITIAFRYANARSFNALK